MREYIVLKITFKLIAQNLSISHKIGYITYQNWPSVQIAFRVLVRSN